MKILSLQLQIGDDEYNALLAHLASKPIVAATLSSSTAGAGGNDDDDNTGVAGEVNKFGVPHLPAVHSGSKKLNADGTWKRLKGITPEQMDAAEKEWIAASQQQQPAQTAAPVAAPVAAIPGIPGLAPGAAGAAPVAAPVAAVPGIPGFAPAAPVAAPVAAAPVAPPPAAIPAATPAPVTIEDLGVAFAALQTKYPTIDQAWIDGLYKTSGVTSPEQLSTDETIRRKVLDNINEVLSR